MTLLFLTMAMTPPMATVAAQVHNGSVRVRILRGNGELVEELSALSPKGEYRPILLSPTHPSVVPEGPQAKPNLLRQGGAGLFDSPPTFRFTDVSLNGKVLRLTSKVGDWTVVKTIELPRKGNTLNVTLDATTPSPYPNIRYLLNTYAFAPGKPDETWTPGLRPNEGEVIGDHFFRSPAAVIRKGSLAATVMPDLDVLKENRPIPTILDLDVANGVVRSPLVSYGFADHRLVGHVRYATDASMVRPVPWELKLKSEIRLDADANQGSAVSAAASHLWERYGRGYFAKILPQTMSFARYAELCYPAAMNEKMTGGWFERTIDGHVCGGIPSGWGLTEGWVSWQCWFNQLRSAWGLRWWGKRLNHPDWVDKADKMLNLALAAPMDRGATPTTYRSKTNDWLGSLVSPSPDCYYDVPSIAWKGIWLLRWLKLPDCPRREEVARHAREIYGLLKRVQQSDGSFPSWLTKSQTVVPILDRSAQSALPVWFIEEYRTSGLVGQGAELDTARSVIDRGIAFLSGKPVTDRLFYDFETFFSCSPKVCLQKDGAIDDRRMWDPHTMQPPQNTLAMQWCAEALFRDPKRARQDKAFLALDTMNMYQNVWPISYRPVAYTFGGFGVQNSDGEYNDARQAQFGATLCDFGAKLGRRDLFERGVAAIRASLTLVNLIEDPYKLYPNANYPFGLEPENCGHGGTNEQNGRTGFDWGEGSGLAAAAEVMDKYGSAYLDDKNSWGVGIDVSQFSPDLKMLGTYFDPNEAAKADIDVEQTVKLASGEMRRMKVAAIPRMLDPIDFGQLWNDETGAGISVPLFPIRGEDLPGSYFIDSSGNRTPASVGTHFATDDGGSATASLSLKNLRNPVSLRGTIKGWPVDIGPLWFLLDPTFSFKEPRLPGWKIDATFLNWPTRSARRDFGTAGLPFIGTCEDGRGGFDDAYVGEMTSPPFYLTKPTIRLLVGGGSVKGVGVELIDHDGKTIAIARGSDDEKMHEVVWTVPHPDQPLRIHIFDRDKGPWGHINVGNIRCQ